MDDLYRKCPECKGKWIVGDGYCKASACRMGYIPLDVTDEELRFLSSVAMPPDEGGSWDVEDPDDRAAARSLCRKLTGGGDV